jgi:putative transposase
LEEVDPGWLAHYAKTLGVDRTGYYRTPSRRLALDANTLEQVRLAHSEHPFYGVRRLSIHLNWSINKTRRARKLAGIRVPSRSKKYKYGKATKPEIAAPQNMLHKFATLKDITRPQAGMSYSGMVDAEAWVQDFTYLWFEHSFHYLATVMSLKTRQIVGWRLGTNHTSDLTHSALLDALSKHSSPNILHSDQGSEYLSYKHRDLCNKMEITLSCSAKSSPWQNGYMERWYGGFKLELGSILKYPDLAHLNEAIALQIHYYNTKRIHTALKMSPSAYADSLMDKKINPKSKLNLDQRIDRVLQKMGA